MQRLSVYEADIRIGSQVHGWIYSFYPMPDYVHCVPRPDGRELKVEISCCNRYILHAPDSARFVAHPLTGDILVALDPRQTSVPLGPKAVLEWMKLDKEFKFERIYWNYCKRREAIERFDVEVRAAAEAEGRAPSRELRPPGDSPHQP